MIKSSSLVRLPVSLFWSFLLLGAGCPHVFCGRGCPVLDGRLVGSGVDHSGACQGQASQSTGQETPVMPAAPSAGQRSTRRIRSRTPHLFGAPRWVCQAEASSGHSPVPSPSRLLLVSVDVLASFSPSPFNLRLCGCSGSWLQQASSSIVAAGCGIQSDRGSNSGLLPREPGSLYWELLDRRGSPAHASLNYRNIQAFYLRWHSSYPLCSCEFISVLHLYHKFNIKGQEENELSNESIFILASKN